VEATCDSRGYLCCNVNLCCRCDVFFISADKSKFLEEGIQIHGMYGEVYTWESIENVSLKEELPTIQIRTNGSALGSKLKGHFKTKELGSVKLFVNTENPPSFTLKLITALLF